MVWGVRAESRTQKMAAKNKLTFIHQALERIACVDVCLCAVIFTYITTHNSVYK